MKDLRSLLLLVAALPFATFSRRDEWIEVACNEYYRPKNCNFNKTDYISVDYMDRCAPSLLPILSRNYFLGYSGRGITYLENKDAFDRIRVRPRMLKGMTTYSLKTTVLGMQVDFPIGLAPVAAHKLAYPEGELATVAGLRGLRTVMILSSYSTTLLESVAKEASRLGDTVHLWMQTYIFEDRSTTIDIVRRAERSGFKAIVLTSDAPCEMKLACDVKRKIKFHRVNVPDGTCIGSNITFKHITWLKKLTKLPIVAKGILSGDDALKAIEAGASAILVSNHGGREMDGDPATIDALPDVVKAMLTLQPPPEVYMDGGIRSGNDVFKAMARGARMVFVGRPQIWGLAMMGAEGVNKMMTFLRDDFNFTMGTAGISNVRDIGSDYLLPSSKL